MTNYITDEVKALIGVESSWVESCDPVSRGEIRRHFQAVMDNDPLYWNDEYAASTRFGGVVAPPLFPLHALRPAPDAPDRLDEFKTDPDYDGSTRGATSGLPQVPVPLPRLLNGGNQIEIYQLARPGEKIRVRSKYVDIYQKDGRSGTLVFVSLETTYLNEKGELLLKATQSRILR